MLSQQNISANTPNGGNLVEGGATFRVFAPRASAVYLNGNFGDTVHDQQTDDPNFGSCLQARRQFACQFATIAGGVNLAGGVLAGLVAGRADIFAAPR